MNYKTASKNSSQFQLSNRVLSLLVCLATFSLLPFFRGTFRDCISVRLLLSKNPVCSFSFPSCQVRGFSFELFPRPWQTVGLVPGPFHCADSSWRREWNTTHPRLELGPDWMESYPLLAVRRLRVLLWIAYKHDRHY